MRGVGQHWAVGCGTQHTSVWTESLCLGNDAERPQKDLTFLCQISCLGGYRESLHFRAVLGFKLSSIHLLSPGPFLTGPLLGSESTGMEHTQDTAANPGIWRGQKLAKAGAPRSSCLLGEVMLPFCGEPSLQNRRGGVGVLPGSGLLSDMVPADPGCRPQCQEAAAPQAVVPTLRSRARQL